MQNPLIVSVVRDLDMYRKCVADNCFCKGCECLMLDNRVRNVTIPSRYNRVLSDLGKDVCRWIMFCHEDFRPLESVLTVLKQADEGRIYGTVGGVLVPRMRWLFGGVWGGVIKGQIIESEKDGSGSLLRGHAVPLDTPVETVDCQCLVVHSSLIAKYGLRFDEQLSFDLYTEDFCHGAFLRHGIETAILPLKCQHYSRGSLQPRFFRQKAYLDGKYPRSEALSCVGYTIGGGRTVMRRIQKAIRTFLDRHAHFAVNWYFKLINRIGAG